MQCITNMSNEQVKDTHAELTNVVASLDYDLARVLSGNKASHTAMRNKLQSVKKLVDTLRKQILTHQKELPTKSRVKKVVVEDSAAVESSDEGVPDDLPEQLVLVRESTSVPKKPRKARKAK